MNFTKQLCFLFVTFLTLGCEGVIPEPGQTEACGDGVIAQFEGCDDGNTEDGDGCSSACLIEEGFNCQGTPSECTSNSRVYPTALGLNVARMAAAVAVGNALRGQPARTLELASLTTPQTRRTRAIHLT